MTVETSADFTAPEPHNQRLVEPKLDHARVLIMDMEQ